MSREPEPAQRNETIRQAIAQRLRERALTALEISGEVRIPAKAVLEHLTHLERSLAATGERLVVEPATCRACGRAFLGRSRYTRPSRCPECKSERISSPRFSLETRPT